MIFPGTCIRVYPTPNSIFFVIFLRLITVPFLQFFTLHNFDRPGYQLGLVAAEFDACINPLEPDPGPFGVLDLSHAEINRLHQY